MDVADKGLDSGIGKCQAALRSLFLDVGPAFGCRIVDFFKCVYGHGDGFEILLDNISSLVDIGFFDLLLECAESLVKWNDVAEI